MKKTYILMLATCLITAISCSKKNHGNRELNCFESNNNCSMDSQFVYVNNGTNATNCIQWDGVNIKNLSAPSTAKVGDSVAIQMQAVAINNSATGNVLFATAHDGTIVEIKTLLQYDVCNTSLQVLTHLPCTYYFVPTTSGAYHFTFINVYGDRTKLNIQVK
jgi:hypothetical protein